MKHKQAKLYNYKTSIVKGINIDSLMTRILTLEWLPVGIVGGAGDHGSCPYSEWHGVVASIPSARSQQHSVSFSTDELFTI